MRALNKTERKAYVRKKAEQRQELRAQIKVLGDERSKHIAAEREKLGQAEAGGFSAAMKQGLRAIAEKKGFTFER